MRREQFESLSDIELVLLQYELKKSQDLSDIKYRNMVLVEIGNRDRENQGDVRREK